MTANGSTIISVRNGTVNGLGGYELMAFNASPDGDVPVLTGSIVGWDRVNNVYYMGYTGSTWVTLGSIS